jgi:hypothetical protein
MQFKSWIELNQMKLGDFPNLYHSLITPEVSSLKGYYQGHFVGPNWLRQIADPGLILAGLRGWWGKYFTGDGKAVNLVKQDETLIEIFPMTIIHGTSLIDGKPGLRLHYESSNPFPWPYIVDELRQFESGILLGMTFIKARMLQGLVLPFILEYQHRANRTKSKIFEF